MWRYAIGIIGVGLGVAFMADTYVLKQELRAEAEQQAEISKQQNEASLQAQNRSRDNIEVTYAGRKTKIRADKRGHFNVTARMNGRKVPVLVDTGATSVAINRSTARRLGIRLSPSDFKHIINTANGRVKAASATIERIEIGRVSANNVRAAVLPDKSLDGTLLGMSFLNQMRSFKISNGELVLSQ